MGNKVKEKQYIEKDNKILWENLCISKYYTNIVQYKFVQLIMQFLYSTRKCIKKSVTFV